MGDLYCMKKIGFLSFGHWTPSPQSQARSATDVLLQSIYLAVEAERLGMDGAYFRAHHFAHQLASPFPLLAAVVVKTPKITLFPPPLAPPSLTPHCTSAHPRPSH